MDGPQRAVSVVSTARQLWHTRCKSAVSMRPTSSGRRILLVDDEEALAWSLSSRLQKARPQDRIETAYDGESALPRVAAEPLDVLIADIRMPGMSGIDLVLAARGLYPELPVVVMTAFKPADMTKLEQGPFTRFLEKPFEFPALLALVEAALNPQPVGFSGAISVQTLPDIVQLYVLSSATGMLRVRNRAGDGLLYFAQGAILHAATSRNVGDEAFYEIMMWSGGEFSMQVGLQTPERTVKSNWQELLMESVRRIDERVRDDDSGRLSKPGWTIAPAILDAAFEEFSQEATTLRAAPLPRDFTESTNPTTETETKMNIKDSLVKLNSIDGFIGAALVDSESGMLLGQEGGGPLNLEVAAAGNTEVVRAKRKTMNNLALKDAIEDILISLSRQYHLIRPLRSRPTIFFYVALDRQRANLAMARIALADVEKELQV
jgi:CheY-like chemotaxis protein